MTMQAQTFQAPQSFPSFGTLNKQALRASYRYHNPIMLTADQVADLAVLAAWKGIDAEMAQAMPTSNPYRKPLALLTDAVDTAPAPSLASFWTPILDIPSLPPVEQAACVKSLVETQLDVLNGRSASPSAKSNIVDAWLEGQTSFDMVVAAHAPRVTYTQRLVRRAYSVLSFVGGYARVR